METKTIGKVQMTIGIILSLYELLSIILNFGSPMATPDAPNAITFFAWQDVLGLLTGIAFIFTSLPNLKKR